VSPLLRLIARDVVRAFAQGGVWLPLVFYLLVATLFPFAIGPDAALLGKVGGGVLWTAALLAALLPVERLVRPDIASGAIDQLVLRGLSDEGVAAAKLVAHWLSFGPPLMAATLAAGALLNLDSAAFIRLEVGLLVGTPGLAALGLAVAALTASLRASGALIGLVMLPLAVPLLIFGASAGPNALKLLGATSLLFVAGAPFVAGAALRAGRS
jgi:heme exporter protein B